MKAKASLVGVTVLTMALGFSMPAAATSAKKSKAKKKPVATEVAIEAYCPPIDGDALLASKPRVLDRMMEKMESPTRGEGFADEGPREGEGWNKWFYGQRKFPAETLPPDAIGKALRAAKRNNKPGQGSGSAAVQQKALAAASWVPLGPSQIPGGQTDTTHGGGPNPFAAGTVSGRVSAIAVDPTDPNVVYCGGAQGGVWKTTNALAANPTWTPISDFEASLAIGDIAIDPVDHNIIYVGTGEANGSCDSYYGQGILRSADGGATWTLLDGGGFFTNQAISRIVIDPDSAGSTTSTTLWASTVLAFYASGTEDCNVPPGAYNGALFRSFDSGATWEPQNVPTGGAGSTRVHDMGLDLENSNVLYVALRGFPETAGGIWRSNNAKAKQAHFNKVDTKFAQVDIADPPVRRITLGVGHQRTLYAALGALGESLWGFYKSTNGGANWQHIDAGNNGRGKLLGTTVTRQNGPPFTASMVTRRIVLDNRYSRTVTAVANGNTLTISGDPITTKPTETEWSVGSYPLYCGGQCFYDMTVGVDPGDPTANTVYVGGNPHTFNGDTSGVPGAHYNWRTLDGGSTWRAVSQGNSFTNGLHTDDHAVAFDLSVSPSRVYDGNDGGVWSSDNQGVSWKNLNTNIAITQFQGLALTAGDSSRVLGGTQDNGTNILNYGGVTPPAWFHTDFGDGGQALIDQTNTDRMFHTYFNASFAFYGPARTFPVAGLPGSWPFAGCYFGYGPQYYNGLGECTDPVSFYAPLASNPSFSPDVIYLGSDRVYRSPEPLPVLLKIPSWTAVSPALTSGGNFVSAIGVLNGTVAGKEVVYAGSSAGEISVSFDVPNAGAGTWTEISAGLPLRFVSEIEVDSSDPTGKTAYATFSGFDANTPATPGHVFKTTDGATWTDISGDLPDISTTCVAIKGSTVYVGTDIGVFQSDDGGAHWVFVDDGLPHVAVFGLDRNLATGDIVASTHGRGMFLLVP